MSGSANAAGTPAPASRRRLGLRATLVIVLVATVTVVCLLVAGVTHASVRSQLHDELDAQLERAASRASDRAFPDGGAGQEPPAEESSPADGGSTSDPQPPGAPSGDQPGSGEFELTAVLEDGAVTSASWRDEDGTLRTLGDEDLAVLQDAVDGLEPGPADGDGPGATTTADLSIGSYRVLATEDEDGTVLVTGLPLEPVRETLMRLDLTLLAAGLGAVLVAGAGGSLIIRRTLRPLGEVARLASDVAGTPLDRGSVTLAERVPARDAVPGTEVGEVGRALNHLLDNVEGAIETRQRSEERMRRFIADASHELRTPLTAIRGYTEMLRLTETLGEQGVRSVDRLDAQSARMASLVEDLLLLTRLDDGAPRGAEAVDLGEIVLESVMDAGAAARDHRVDVRVPDEPVIVTGDARQLTQVVVNLLSNARKHTPAGTRVAVRLRGEEDRALLDVADDGPGIDPELLPDIFSRFTRADRARSGDESTTGLGLSIVRAIAAAHDGDVTVRSRPGETVFTLALPRADA